MRRFGLFFWVGLFIATANCSIASEVQADNCRQIYEKAAQLINLERPQSAAITEQNNTCLFEGFNFFIGNFVRYKTDQIILSDSNIIDKYRKKLSHTLKIEIKGIRLYPMTKNNAINYFTSIGSPPINITIEYKYDDLKKTLNITDFSLYGRSSVGHLKMSALLVEMPDLSALSEKTGTFVSFLRHSRLSSLDLYLDDDGFVAKLLSGLGPTLMAPDTENPEKEFARILQDKQEQARHLLTDMGANQETIRALNMFIGAFPSPDKVLDLSLRPAQPISLINDWQEEAKAHFPPGKITARYEKPVTR